MRNENSFQQCNAVKFCTDAVFSQLYQLAHFSGSIMLSEYHQFWHKVSLMENLTVDIIR